MSVIERDRLIAHAWATGNVQEYLRLTQGTTTGSDLVRAIRKGAK